MRNETFKYKLNISYKFVSAVVYVGNRGVGAHTYDCNDMLWVRFRLKKMKYLIFYLPYALVTKQRALTSSTQHAMSSEFHEKSETECLNEICFKRFPGSLCLLCYTEYSVKLKFH